MTEEQMDIFYRATLERDATFDGVFFLGVKTTGIYCRPICPAPKPKRKNVIYFASVDEAAVAGFRACKRCRPEARPGSPAWKGSEATVHRALRMIADGELTRLGSEGLADKLGITDRHLRRLFQDYLGRSPKEADLLHKMSLSKSMLAGSDMAITDIAMQAGFGSLRRFNDAFKKATSLSPSAWRKEHDQKS